MPKLKTKQTAVRLAPELLQRVDDYAAAMCARVPGANFTRADAVRTLMTLALDHVDADGMFAEKIPGDGVSVVSVQKADSDLTVRKARKAKRKTAKRSKA